MSNFIEKEATKTFEEKPRKINKSKIEELAVFYQYFVIFLFVRIDNL